MKIKLFILAITISFSFSLSFSQIISVNKAKAIVNNAESVVLLGDEYLPSYIKFKEGEEINLESLQSWLINNFNLSSDFGLKLISSENDQYGFTHYRYKQTINGYPVLGGEYIAHVINGKIISLNGKIRKKIEISADVVLTESTALSYALKYVKASKYKWQLPEEENFLKNITGNSDASYYPKAELYIVSENGKLSSNKYFLTYRFDIYASEPLSRQYIFVDTKKGNIVTTLNRIHNTDITGTAVTKYSGSQTITTDSYNSSFRLRETGRGNGIETYDLNNSTSYSTADDFIDADNYWNNVNAQEDEVATDAHWGAEKTYDFYYTKYNRNSIDGNGLKLISYVHYSSNFSNAFWDSQCMTYGDGGSSYSPFTALDICAHEITHGLDEFTANLVYQDEPGALNEGFSDIFAAAIEFYAKPSMANWTMGENIGVILRSLSNPNAYSDPDTYLGTNWYAGTGDYGGVHTNCTVLGHWFYLVSQGGSGTNDIGNNYNVTGIGIDKAAAIAYRTLTYYLTSASEYSDARTYSILACQDLYGGCSPETQTVANAWHAVGVGVAWASSNTNADFNANITTACTLPVTVQFNNLSSNANNYKWYFGDGTSSTLSNPTHTYNSGGNYDIKLAAYGGTCGNDSITKTSYIIINVPTAPTANSVSRCGTGSVTLTATGSGTLNWYNSQTGGNIINTGTSYTTPSLSSTTTYYVANEIASPTQNAGKTDNAGGGGYLTNPDQYLIFDCYSPVKLISVVVYAGSTGYRTFELRNSSGSVLQTATVNLTTSGQQTVTLNFDIPAGTNLQLGLQTGSTANLYRNNNGINYPYTTTGLISVTGSSAGSNYYYYLYNWQIQKAPCSSARIPITATINQYLTPYVNISAQPTGTVCHGTIVTYTATSSNGGTTPLYQWLINSINTGTNSPAFSTTANNNDIISCTMTSSEQCVTANPASSNLITVSLYPPIETPIISLNNNILSSSADYGNQWYSITNSGNSIIISANSQNYIPLLSGSYYTIVTDSNGCISDTSNILYLNLANNFNIYPNPSNGEFVIISTSNSNNSAEIEIYDILGQAVFKGYIRSNLQKFSLKNISDGIYFIKIKANNETITRKIVVGQ